MHGVVLHKYWPCKAFLIRPVALDWVNAGKGSFFVFDTSTLGQLLPGERERRQQGRFRPTFAPSLYLLAWFGGHMQKLTEDRIEFVFPDLHTTNGIIRAGPVGFGPTDVLAHMHRFTRSAQ